MDDSRVLLRYDICMDENNKDVTTVSAISWYRSRIFWGVALGMLMLVGIAIFILYYNVQGTNFGNFMIFTMAFGGFPLMAIFTSLFGNSELVKMFGLVAYNIIFFSLIFLSLYKPKVNLIYPLFTIAIFFIGLVIAANGL